MPSSAAGSVNLNIGFPAPPPQSGAGSVLLNVTEVPSPNYLRLGVATPTDLRVGSTQVLKIYRGTTQLYGPTT